MSDAKHDEPQTTEMPEAVETTSKTNLAKKHYHAAKAKAGLHFARFKPWYLGHKKLSIPLSGLVLLAVILAIPFSRYTVLGLVIRKDVLVYTVDSQSHEGVSNTIVKIDGKSPGCKTHNVPYPNCFAKVPLGRHTVKVEAAYYRSAETTFTVTISKSGEQNIEIPLVSTGRTLGIRVINKITGLPVKGIQVKAGNSAGVTNDLGDGRVVVDPSLTSTEIELSGDGYNSVKASVPVKASEANSNQLSIVPAGRVYFLSKLSGKIDVVKTNLDGTDRQTVIAGTGKEEDGGTVLLASRDWKYLALLARRDSDLAKLYLIETSSDKLSIMDEGNANFSLSGWSDSTLVYTVTRNEKAYSDAKRQAIKSFNAVSGKLTTLAENASEAQSGAVYYQSFGTVQLAAGLVIYSTNVYSTYYYVYTLPSFGSSITSVKPDGSSKKSLKSFPGVQAGFTVQFWNIDSSKPEPAKIEYSVNHDNKTDKYVWDHGSFKAVTGEDKDSETYLTYLASPSGKSTFWYEPRDGKNTLFIGDPDGKNGKLVANLSEYSTYGWYTDDYLLVSKNGSELYVLPAADSVDASHVIKISDYHKPNFSFNGYGGGYGGL